MKVPPLLERLPRDGLAAGFPQLLEQLQGSGDIGLGGEARVRGGGEQEAEDGAVFYGGVCALGEVGEHGVACVADEDEVGVRVYPRGEFVAVHEFPFVDLGDVVQEAG